MKMKEPMKTKNIYFPMTAKHISAVEKFQIHTWVGNRAGKVSPKYTKLRKLQADEEELKAREEEEF